MVKGCLKGMFGSPSLTKIQGRTLKKTKNIYEKHQKTKLREIYAHVEVVVTLVVVNFSGFLVIASHRQIVTKIGGKTSYRPPGPS